jgi:hypothetical protein
MRAVLDALPDAWHAGENGVLVAARFVQDSDSPLVAHFCLTFTNRNSCPTTSASFSAVGQSTDAVRNL